ncbi:muts domain V-domain-containing protein [Roridomyces roridus]|uniref:DNA mismatch repair protein MSH3 n=1 Tax=Roridomyces roridus TaxID=1738132 RepID=A0AAD7F9P6_9AGAR|nr:muts domain V-domain-containing protein [Roridomyces roridus]
MNRPSSHRRSFRPSSRPNTSRSTAGQSRTGPDIDSRPTTTQTSRPWTAQTRPGTARPTTAASTRQEGASYVIALLEGRGVAREVGIAALDRETGRVMLVQLADCQTYVKTLHQMHIHSPVLVLVPDTFLSPSGTAPPSLLVEYIYEEFPGVPVEPIGRKYWNETGGLEFISQLCVEDDERAGTLIAVANKYYALSAACALFKHAETKLNTRFAAASLRIRYVPVEGTMMVDPDTARNLELVGNMAHKKSAHSLFGTVNHTYTAMAARLLRVNILSPITAQSSIDARLDVVEELVQSEERFTEVRAGLKALNKMDFDKLIASLASSETKPSMASKTASARVAQMLELRNLVRNLPTLQKTLEGCTSQLLRIVYDMLSDERLANIERLVGGALNEDGAPAKGGIAAVNARVYAVKANCNRLLDVARETYKENVGDIFQLNRTLTDTHGLPLALVYQETGFVFALRKDELEGNELPRGFVNPSLKKGKWTFSSMELKKMNARMKDALDETLILSEKIIQDLVADILGDVGALYKASEAVALLDMLWSFAHTSIMHNYVRPEFTGTLAIKSGRHPILETVKSAGTLVPNDVYCDDSSSFQIVQGHNMSGKSTYLRQVGLLTVLAMCGCFVPAEYASFRIHDALLTRLSNDDDMEKNLSTFASEMATSAMILGLASPQSLVLVDELGRGTSPREGVGISHAIAEGLIERKSFVFFATHFKELATTLSRQPTVINLHLSVQRTTRSDSNFGLTFQYKIVDGAPDDSTHYGKQTLLFVCRFVDLRGGLELARLADLPKDVLGEGKRVAEKLAALHARNKEDSESNKIAIRRKALLRLRTQLTQAFEHSAVARRGTGGLHQTVPGGYCQGVFVPGRVDTILRHAF